jgi:uncharacterized protein YjiS (DUF1127 family)
MKVIRKMFERFFERRRYRRSLQPLFEASDRELKDLGLSRQHLMYLSAGHQIQRPLKGYEDCTSL